MTGCGDGLPKIQGCQEQQQSFFSYLAILLIGSLWVHLSTVNFLKVLDLPILTWGPVVYLALFLRNGALIFVLIFRRPSTDGSKQLKEWIVAILGTVAGLWYSPLGTISMVPAGLHTFVYVLMLYTLCVCVLAISSLGRSFGIVPANRGIKTEGLYSVVRHPIYAVYIVFDLLFLVVNFSVLNLAVFSVFVLALYLRACYEEGLLRQDPAYLEYVKKTPYMLIPGVF